jgi:uncharacterized protein
MRRQQARDKAPQAPTHAHFFTTEQLGQNQALTPEGFLAVKDVPMCRTGMLLYGPGEVPIEPGEDGIIRIWRDPEEVFAERHIMSFVGKPLVNEHPPMDVIPANWKQFAVGTVMNPRRGEGANADAVLADLIVYDPGAIAEIRSGKRELSCGYEADYLPTGPGEGKQQNLIANHLALVASGRCGPRCAIGDRDPTDTSSASKGDKPMGAFAKWLAEVRQAIKTNDASAAEKVLDRAPRVRDDDDDDDRRRAKDDDDDRRHAKDDDDDDRRRSRDRARGRSRDDDDEAEEACSRRDFEAHRATFDKHVKDNASEHSQFHERLSKLEGGSEKTTTDEDPNKTISGELELEAPPGTGDKAAKARDSVYLADSFQETLAGAEILAPGIRVPTFDKAASPKATFDAICGLRRDALRAAYASADMRGAIDQLNGGRALVLDNLPCSRVRDIFRGAVVARKALAAAQVRASTDTGVAGGAAGAKAIRSPADLNRANREFWSRQ